jgi:hypothetical protein
VKTSPSSFRSIEHVSIIRPINIDESEVNDTQDADQEDPSFEAKAQAAIDQYWAKNRQVYNPAI